MALLSWLYFVCYLFFLPAYLNGVQKYNRIVKLKAGSAHLSLLSDSHRRAPRTIKIVYQENTLHLYTGEEGRYDR